ncbi:MAG: ATP-binding protein [Candidatus Kapabacteria bacterium]|nr:ATP-binding protein [Candidatus Kapabacteria bacterium]
MFVRQNKYDEVTQALKRSRVVLISGPRQSGKTTLARQFVPLDSLNYLDCENPIDLQRIESAMLSLGELRGLVVIDEIQRRPELFPILRVLADRPGQPATFLILGSTSGRISGQAAESLAGRIETVALDGFRVNEIDSTDVSTLWVRGGFPLSFLASSEDDSNTWRRSFVQTFLERDLAALGIRVQPTAMFRFWNMVAHYHGQTWQTAGPARAMNTSERNVREYIDALTDTFMIRQLQPYHANIAKRQIKAPKLYFRDSGLLHHFLNVQSMRDLYLHPRLGASWEGFVIENVLSTVQHSAAWFWGTHAGAEIDLVLHTHGALVGIEVKRVDAPKLTPSMKLLLQIWNSIASLSFSLEIRHMHCMSECKLCHFSTSVLTLVTIYHELQTHTILSRRRMRM